MAIDAMINRDLPLIQGLVLTFAVIFIALNLVVDLLVTLARSEAAAMADIASRPRTEARAWIAALEAWRPAAVASAARWWRCCCSPRCWRRCSRRTIRSIRICCRRSCRRPGRRAAIRAYIFGTDSLGRDMLSRLIYAARIAVIGGLVAASLACLIGSLLGLVAGYLRRLGRSGRLAADRRLDVVSAGAAVDRAGRGDRRRARPRSSWRSSSSTGRASPASCAPRPWCS